jgi:hypothetical protein
MKKEATPKNTKGLIQKASDEKRCNLKNAKGLLKRPPMKKRQPRKTQWGSLKRPPMKKEATPTNTKGLAQKTSDEKRGNHNKSFVPH